MKLKSHHAASRAAARRSWSLVPGCQRALLIDVSVLIRMELAKSTAYDIYRTTVRTFGQPVAIKKRHTGADRFAIGVWDGKRWRELVKRTRDLDGSAEATTSCNQIDLVAQLLWVMVGELDRSVGIFGAISYIEADDLLSHLADQLRLCTDVDGAELEIMPFSIDGDLGLHSGSEGGDPGPFVAESLTTVVEVGGFWQEEVRKATVPPVARPGQKASENVVRADQLSPLPQTVALSDDARAMRKRAAYREPAAVAKRRAADQAQAQRDSAVIAGAGAELLEARQRVKAFLAAHPEDELRARPPDLKRHFLVELIDVVSEGYRLPAANLDLSFWQHEHLAGRIFDLALDLLYRPLLIDFQQHIQSGALRRVADTGDDVEDAVLTRNRQVELLVDAEAAAVEDDEDGSPEAEVAGLIEALLGSGEEPRDDVAVDEEIGIEEEAEVEPAQQGSRESAACERDFIWRFYVRLVEKRRMTKREFAALIEAFFAGHSNLAVYAPVLRDVVAALPDDAHVRVPLYGGLTKYDGAKRLEQDAKLAAGSLLMTFAAFANTSGGRAYYELVDLDHPSDDPYADRRDPEVAEKERFVIALLGHVGLNGYGGRHVPLYVEPSSLNAVLATVRDYLAGNRSDLDEPVDYELAQAGLGRSPTSDSVSPTSSRSATTSSARSARASGAAVPCLPPIYSTGTVSSRRRRSASRVSASPPSHTSSAKISRVRSPSARWTPTGAPIRVRPAASAAPARAESFAGRSPAIDRRAIGVLEGRTLPAVGADDGDDDADRLRIFFSAFVNLYAFWVVHFWIIILIILFILQLFALQAPVYLVESAGA